MTPFYGWDATASRLEPLLEKALKAPLSHFKFEQTFAFFAFDFFDHLKCSYLQKSTIMTYNTELLKRPPEFVNPRNDNNDNNDYYKYS